MTDDKRDGDDLFEDLDKFFAPIKDVDWDEPGDTPAEQIPQEEHVAVHVAEPVPSAAASPEQSPAAFLEDEALEEEAQEGEAPEEAAPEAAPEVAAQEEGAQEEAAWYDTGVMDTVE